MRVREIDDWTLQDFKKQAVTGHHCVLLDPNHEGMLKLMIPPLLQQRYAGAQ